MVQFHSLVNRGETVGTDQNSKLSWPNRGCAVKTWSDKGLSLHNQVSNNCSSQGE